jgi:N-acetylglucosamine kinase-like BadF-type ATPase
MVIIIESGSTKADWLIIQGEKRFYHSTMGFNPFFHSSELVAQTLENDEVLKSLSDQEGEIHFYGAGCSSKELNQTIKKGFKTAFKNATVSVDHDLLAAGLALYRGKNVIACILGTGSNSLLFDGTNLHEEVPALGYILGDEGSGSFFGKQMLTDFLYNRLPEQMDSDIRQMGLSKDEIFRKVYMEPNANVFLASISPILIQNKELEYCQNLIRKGFDLFLDRHVLCFKDCFTTEVSFVGSIAALLASELEAVCQEKGLTVGQIIRKPIDSLANYHLKK